MQNGDIKEYRVISSMMASGFFISPLIDNTTAFAALVADDKSLIVSQKVKSFSLINPDDVFLYWNDEIHICTTEPDKRALQKDHIFVSEFELDEAVRFMVKIITSDKLIRMMKEELL